MATTPDQLVELNKTALETFQAVALKSVEGFEKLAELQIQTLKATVGESSGQVKAALSIRDAKSLGELSPANLQPSVEKFNSYARQFYAIGNETGNEIVKIIEKQFAEGNKQFNAAVEEMAKNAPAGSEGVVTLMKSAVSAANNAYDQVNKATKQAVELAEQNVAAATKPITQAMAASKKVA